MSEAANARSEYSSKEALLGALSIGRLSRLSEEVSRIPALADPETTLDGIVTRLSRGLRDTPTAYLVLNAPFDEPSRVARERLVQSMSARMAHSYDMHGISRTAVPSDVFQYAAELPFACLRRSFDVEPQRNRTPVLPH